MPPKKKASAPAAGPEDDVSMADASPPPADISEPMYDIELDEQRIRIVSSVALECSEAYADHSFQLPGASDTAASFEFKKEDHTLGNALRYIIMKKSAFSAL